MVTSLIVPPVAVKVDITFVQFETGATVRVLGTMLTVIVTVLEAVQTPSVPETV